MAVGINVVDTISPLLDVMLDKTVLWSPNHKLDTVTAQVYGSDSGSGIESIVLTSITSNETDQNTERRRSADRYSKCRVRYLRSNVQSTGGTLD